MNVPYHLLTLFLFTKSDIVNTVIPITILSLVVAPACSLSCIPRVLLWIWLHLLQFDVSNQTINLEEDAENKPDRPIPSGRITLQNAIRLRWGLVPVCWAVSLLFGVEILRVSVVLVAMTVLYNELGLESNWYTKNFMTAVGFASFQAGGTLLAGCHRSKLDSIAILAIFTNIGVLSTTVHAQDFKDELGDRLVGRKTIPIVFPSSARTSMLATSLFWAICLCVVWEIDILISGMLLCLSAFVGVRFLTKKTTDDDRISYYLYTLWLLLVYILPGYWRFYNVNTDIQNAYI